MHKTAIRAAIFTFALAAATTAHGQAVKLKDVRGGGRFDAVPLASAAVPGTRGVAILFPEPGELRLYPRLFDGSADGPIVAKLPGFATQMATYLAGGQTHFLVVVPSQRKVLDFGPDLKPAGEFALDADAGQPRIAVRPGERPTLLVRYEKGPQALAAFDLATRKPLPPIPLVGAAGGRSELPDNITVDPTGKLLYATRSGTSPSGLFAFRFEPAAAGAGETLRPLVYHHASGRFVTDRRGATVGFGRSLYDPEFAAERTKRGDSARYVALLLDRPGVVVLGAGSEFAFADVNAPTLEPLARFELPDGQKSQSIGRGEASAYALPNYVADETAESRARSLLVTHAEAWTIVDLAKLKLPERPNLRLALDGPAEVAQGARSTWRVRAAPGVVASLAGGPAGATLAPDGTLAWTADAAGVAEFKLEARSQGAGDATPLAQSFRVSASEASVPLDFYPDTVVAGGPDFTAVVAASLSARQRNETPSLATIDRKSMTRVAQRTLGQRAYRLPIATDGRHVFIGIDDSDAVDVLDFRTLESVKLIRVPRRFNDLRVVGNELIVGDPTATPGSYVIAAIDLATLEPRPVTPDAADGRRARFEAAVRRDANGAIVELYAAPGTATPVGGGGGAMFESPASALGFDVTSDGATLTRRGGQVVGPLGDPRSAMGRDGGRSTRFAPGGVPLIARLEFAIEAAGGADAGEARDVARVRKWSVRVWDYDAAERATVPLFVARDVDNDPTQPALVPCGPDVLAAVTGPRVQFVTVDALRAAAGTLPTPLHVTRGPDPLVLPRAGRATLALSIAGGTPPYRVEPFQASAYVTAEGTSVVVDVDAALATIKPSPPWPRNPTLPPQPPSSSEFFRFVAGRDPQGRAAALPIGVRVTDAAGRTVARPLLVLLDAPAEPAADVPAIADGATTRPASPDAPAGDELSRLRAELERLRVENALLRDLLMQRQSATPAPATRGHDDRRE